MKRGLIEGFWLGILLAPAWLAWKWVGGVVDDTDARLDDRDLSRKIQMCTTPAEVFRLLREDSA